MWLFGGAVWRRERGLIECRAPLHSRVGNPATGLFFELPGAAVCSSLGSGLQRQSRVSAVAAEEDEEEEEDGVVSASLD